MRTPIEALKEIRDRLTYFCLRTDGKYDPPWATELVGIIDDILKYKKNTNNLNEEALGLHKHVNAAALREVLVCLRDAARNFCHQILNSKYSVIMDKYTCCKQGFPAVLDLRYAIPKANFAISKPPRNCDVGTAEEQAERQTRFCMAHQCGTNCPAWRKVQEHNGCVLAWAQMPYEAQEGGAK